MQWHCANSPYHWPMATSSPSLTWWTFQPQHINANVWPLTSTVIYKHLHQLMFDASHLATSPWSLDHCSRITLLCIGNKSMVFFEGSDVPWMSCETTAYHWSSPLAPALNTVLILPKHHAYLCMINPVTRAFPVLCPLCPSQFQPFHT